jgi:hypothetical protein
MQWHPLFVRLLRPLVEGHYEVRTDLPVGDVPRSADVVLLRKADAGPPPYRGLWSRLTTWNLQEYKGPTVSARLDDLHRLLELGLGVHRRLNELAAQEGRPAVGYAEVSFWYLVNHLGRRFRADLRGCLPGVQQEAPGLWRATVFWHPVFLVSVRELAVERDSLPLHVLAGVPEAARATVVEALKAEPSLWPNYWTWLSANEPAIWQEIVAMVAKQAKGVAPKLGPLADYLRQGGRLEDVKAFLDALGAKRVVEAVGADQLVEAVGAERFWAELSPELREELLRRAPPSKSAGP